MARTKSNRILALLLNPNYFPKSKYEIAKKVGSSPAWAIIFLKKLEKKKLMKGLEVKDVNGLFELFHKKRAKKQTYKKYSLGNATNFIDSLKDSKREYAFTSYLAENILQNYLFTHRVDIYIKKEDLKDWHKKMIKLGTYGEGNFRLIISEHDELFNRKQIGTTGPWIVNLAQLISDLKMEGGSAEEAAEKILKKLKKEFKERQ